MIFFLEIQGFGLQQLLHMPTLQVINLQQLLHEVPLNRPPQYAVTQDENVKLVVYATSDLPLTPIKEERSSSPNQSQNNNRACYIEHKSEGED